MTKPDAPPEHIDASEMAYHRSLIGRVRGTQTAAQEVARLQQQIAAAQGAFESWAEHLHHKYGLGPGEGVDENGRIHRAVAGDDHAERNYAVVDGG